MKDFDVCMGTGDIPTPIDNDSPKIVQSTTPEEIREMKKKGYIQDSTGSWFNPNNYIDSYYMDW